MDIRCPACGDAAEPAGYEDARAFFQCRNCNRVWATALSSLGATQNEPAGRNTLRVMVVDDSEDLVKLLATWIADEGYDVITASSGREAISAAAIYYPDIVLLDLMMPPPDGFHVCEQLAKRLSPQVIVMTGLSDPRYLQRAADLGVVAVLNKPLTPKRVLEAISEAADRCARDPLSRLRRHFGLHPR